MHQPLTTRTLRTDIYIPPHFDIHPLTSILIQTLFTAFISLYFFNPLLYTFQLLLTLPTSSILSFPFPLIPSNPIYQSTPYSPLLLQVLCTQEIPLRPLSPAVLAFLSKVGVAILDIASHTQFVAPGSDSTASTQATSGLGGVESLRLVRCLCAMRHKKLNCPTGGVHRSIQNDVIDVSCIRHVPLQCISILVH